MQTVQDFKEDAMNIVTSIPESDLAVSKQAAYEPLFKRPPRFENLEQERQHRKERLAAGFRIFGALGFSEGVAGHITARDPEFTDTFWVNPFGMHFAHVTVSDLIRVVARYLWERDRAEPWRPAA